MPRYNPHGDLAAGYGGDGHYLSINLQPMFPAPSALIGWFTPDEAAIPGGDYTRIVTVHRHRPHVVERVLYEGPSLATRVGGGRFAVQIPDGRWRVDGGDPQALMGVEMFGDDGSLVHWAHAGGGLVIAGQVIEPTAHCSGIHVFTRDVALWQMRGEIHTLGMPRPRVLPGVAMHFRACWHNGEWWGIYQSTFNDRLVCHPFSGPERGYILNGRWGTLEGNAFRPDLCSVNGQIRACWAVVESEFPDQVREVDVLSLPQVDLTATSDPTDPEEPEEPDMPEYEIPEELQDQRDLVESVRPQPYSDTYDVNAEWAKRIAIALKKKYPHIPVGVARAKPGSDNHGGPIPDVEEGFTTDVVALKSGVHWDFKADGGRALWNLEDDERNYPPIASRFYPAEKLDESIPDPGGDDDEPLPPVRPELAPVQARLTDAALAVLSAQRALREVPPCPEPEPVECPPCELPHGAIEIPPYPSGPGGIVELLNEAFRAGRRERGHRAMDMDPGALGHLLFGHWFESRSVDEIVNEALRRGRGEF